MYIVTLLIQLICRAHQAKCWAGWITSWNQDCREKYQKPQICRWYHSNGRKRRGTKKLFAEGKRGEWKTGLKTQHNKTKIVASSPITSWQIEGEKVETVTEFIFLGSKITAEGDRSPEIKRLLLLGRKTMTNLDNILKSRDITLLTNIHIVKIMAFPVVKYRCESWTIMKTETKELMLSNCGAGEDSWESLGQQGDQTSLKEVNLEYSLERLMLKLQCFGHLIQR